MKQQYHRKLCERLIRVQSDPPFVAWHKHLSVFVPLYFIKDVSPEERKDEKPYRMDNTWDSRLVSGLHPCANDMANTNSFCLAGASFDVADLGRWYTQSSSNFICGW